MAASGGYYIATPADKIYANRNCWTGSIGVTVGTFIDISGFLENYGIKTTTIDSGKNKSMGSYFDPLTTEQQVIFQAMVDEAYDQFADIVAYERGIDIAKVKEIADGRIYTAKQAADLGLVDVVGTYGDAVSDIRATYNLYDCEIFEVRYVYKSLLPNLFGSINSGVYTDAAAIMKLIEKRGKFPISYLCEALAE
jgi:protease-4